MSILKYIERLKKMDDLIFKKATGNSNEFAKQMNVSPAQLFKDMKEMRELGAPIKYSQENRSYFYTNDCKLILDFIRPSEESIDVFEMETALR
jgi:predicted DNA-binding transcriptional regulator YafY